MIDSVSLASALDSARSDLEAGLVDETLRALDALQGAPAPAELSASLHALRGDALWAARRLAEARDAYACATAADPACFDALWGLAVVCAELGFFAEAVDAAFDARSVSRGVPALTAVLLEFIAALGGGAEVSRSLDAALEAEPDSHDLLVARRLGLGA